MSPTTFNPSILLISLVTLFVTNSVNAHIDTPCQHLVSRNYTPCFNLVTGSSSSTNGSNPTAECCNEFNKLSNNDIDCVCLIFLGTIPVQFTYLRNLQAVLPPSCNVSGVPLKCKGYGTPLPAPGPTLSDPDHSPAPAAHSPTGSTQVPRPDGPQKIEPVLNPASDGYSLSEPATVVNVWCAIIAVATWFLKY